MRTIIVAVTIAIVVFCTRHSVAQQPDGSQGLKTYSVDVPETSEWQNKSDSSQLLFGRTLSSPLSTLALSAGPSQVCPWTGRFTFGIG